MAAVIMTATATSPHSRFVIGGRLNFNVRVTEAQRAEIQRRAADQGISMSEWALRAIEVALKKTKAAA